MKSLPKNKGTVSPKHPTALSRDIISLLKHLLSRANAIFTCLHRRRGVTLQMTKRGFERPLKAIQIGIEESCVELLLDGRDPQPGRQCYIADAFFAFRILLGRNPDPDTELPSLVDAASRQTLRELLNSLLTSKEFAGRTAFMPPGHQLMAELREFKFWFDTGDAEMGVRMGLGLYEPESSEFFRKTIVPGMICWDIGAQTGYYTCLFSHLSGPLGIVCAFEPMPENFRLLERNIAENGLQLRVTARNAACSDCAGTIAMTAVSHMYVATPKSDQSLAVECVRLDTQNLPAPDLIKIDVEGHEPAVLRGLSGLLAKRSPIIVLELNEYWLKNNSGSTGQAVLRWLNEAGYQTFSMDNLERIDWRHFYQVDLDNSNVFALRQ